VANIEEEPATARAEAGMAAIGPIVSILLGAAFTVLGGLASGRADVASDPEAAFASMGPLQTLLTWLGPVNIVLGIFNMIPAFPLDGGRVLRALLWGLTGDLARATRWATLLGQGIAWLLIVAGVAMAFGVTVPFFGRGLISGLWLAFIGWFMNGAARMSYRQVKVRSLLEGVPLRALLKRPLAPAVGVAVPIADFVEGVAAPSTESVFPVSAGDEVVGLLAVEDLRKLPRAAWHSTPAAELMSPISTYPRADADDDLYAAMRLLGSSRRNVLVVFDGGRLLGLVRHEDIARWIELQAMAEPDERTATYPHARGA
jgi:Zn-dependent protease